ncbi:A disintegrin and metalloproteinase with thrombospondin motifs 7-like [Cryptotermes secundus]|uniref:A disintegrin and metalloproteinase with thrombospondin motifs 7-like n=1 Tax=Cryptotermes secundus TaxID=105785 RepID=UPI001454BD51|nr:A disintegrin and metalloproteinase with thrombospondin motifs 7-like [Cryptotermes secundus]
MWPNHGLLAPGFLVETRPSGAATDLNKVKIRSVGDTQCHYTGWIKGEHGSRVALSVCNGIAGHIRTKQNHYYIEPVKDHEPEEDGQHLHMVYQRSVHNKNERSCGTSDDWETAWANRLRAEYHQREGPYTDLKADFAKRQDTYRSMQDNRGKRSYEGKTNYLETLVVADKKFLQTRNGTDYEQFLLTAVNMAADIFHDDSVGHQLDLTLVRVIYLEKEEEEVDLTINIDADETLTSFCKWATRINPATSHPNHHDIAVLFTKYDICAGMDDCGAVGLANIAGCCGKDLSCAICQDTGLVVGTVMAHEIGHLLGANHDSDEDNPPPGECPGAVGEFNIHVMASWSQVSPANWSVCSRNYITEFLENDLGACLLDEPQDHDFKFPQMPPGVVYDRAWQCRDYYGPTEPCDLGPERNCIHLSCKPHGSKKCQTKGPPADGTSCGNNKWCFEGKCVEVGVRPGAINGEWGEWSSWSECSRTCGGGAQYIERKCNNPRPANNGRYCVGKHRQYRLCNIEPCAEDSLTFREFQCQEHNEDDIKWTPFNDGKPEHVCSLMCLSNKYVVKTLKRRVEDGTSCKRGTKNKCIAGRCRNVGCDLVLDSDAVEDICGVCNGDASTCEIVDEVYRENGKGYKKIVTIPAGSRQITVEEMKPSNNFLAVSAADGKTFYLNGNHEIDPDGESKIAGSISAYSNVEPGQESLVISGPIKEDIILYLLNSANPNPGIHYRFSIPSTSSNYKPKFSWQLVNWSPCSVFCGGGTQFSEPSCIEERGGKVSNKHCENLPKPEVNTRLCNEQTCKIRWRTSEWSKCSGCIDKPGHKLRVVECVKQSPFEDSEVIIEESECKKEKPSHKESCTSKEPCGEKSPKRQVSLDDELVSLEDEQRYDTSSGCRKNEVKPIEKEENRENIFRDKGQCTEDEEDEEEECDEDEERNNEESKKKIFYKGNENKCDEETTTIKEGLVVDKEHPEKFKIFQIPMKEDVNDFNFSDEALENVADKVASPIDPTKVKVVKGEEAQRLLQDSKKKNKADDESEEDADYDYVNTKETEEHNGDEDETEC